MDETRLLDLFNALAASDRQSLLDFAEFLQSRTREPNAPVQAAPEKPAVQPLPRPSQETVVAALKRLSASYPMLDKSKLLNETSGLVTQHIIQGREPNDVIDELEAIFVHHYRRWRGEDE